MPHLRMPYLSVRTLMATLVILAGIAAMLVALLGSVNSSSSDSPSQTSNRASIEPVAPLNTDNAEQRPEKKGKKKKKRVDPDGPFADSYGKSSRRKVEIRVTGNGTIGISVSYRDGEKADRRVITGEYVTTRSFKGRFPMAAVTVQIPRSTSRGATRATCTISIDGVEVTRQTTTRPEAPTFCVY